jgi:hypothetical protein
VHFQMASALQLISLVPNRLCQEATVCSVLCWLHLDPIPLSLSPSATEYFHLVAPGPVLGRIPEKGHLNLKKRMAVWTRCVATSIDIVGSKELAPVGSSYVLVGRCYLFREEN